MTSSSSSRINVLIGCTGSVAAIKLNEMVDKLIASPIDCNICIVPTQHALHFIDGFEDRYLKKHGSLTERLQMLTLKSTSQGHVFAFTDQDEWSAWSKRSDPVLHIELRKWAHLFLIAPLDANTLAKLSNGICDNLLTCIARAWDIGQIAAKPIVICPAMNTFMYVHPLTKRQLDLLVNELGFLKIDCIEKTLICGDTGIGAMANVDDIVHFVVNLKLT